MLDARAGLWIYTGCREPFSDDRNRAGVSGYLKGFTGLGFEQIFTLQKRFMLDECGMLIILMHAYNYYYYYPDCLW